VTLIKLPYVSAGCIVHPEKSGNSVS
jgi:hypothetical protein